MRSFIFTLNNYKKKDRPRILRSKRFSYVIIGKEVGENGTRHLQGYCELVDQTRVTTVRKWYGNRWHVEARRGTQEKAIAYCKKEGRWKEAGERRVQGSRGDLDYARHDAMTHGMRNVSGWGNLQQIRTAQIYLTYNEPGRNWKPTVHWLHGPSGAGKSKRARELCVAGETYVKNTPNKWWPGYDRHEYVIIDDLKGSWHDWNLGYLLGLLDRYEYRVECKGGERQFLARVIVITSINPPDDEFHDPEGELMRRIDFVTEVGGNTG